jgi:hypothetical protein
VNLDCIASAIYDVVDVTPCLRHQPAPNDAIARLAIKLPEIGGRAQTLDCAFELLEKQISGIAVSTPPRVFAL